MSLQATKLGITRARVYRRRYASSLLTFVTWTWFYSVTLPSGAVQVIGPYPDQRICRDWLGSCLFKHGPKCLTDPNEQNCAPIGPGWGPTVGVTCSTDCIQIGERQGFYYMQQDHTLAGPYTKHKCEQLSDKCFGVGELRNTEGSNKGP